MAKIHTVEWTPAILPHPIIQIAMRTNWSGLGGEESAGGLRVSERRRDPRRHCRLQADHHAAPYSLTEEFVSVYRMHPLIPTS